MAKKPSHYKVTVNRCIEIANARLRPGARYTIKASVLDQLKAQAPAAIVSEDPIITE